MLPDKIGALIFEGHSLLLVCDDITPFYWIPGGKIASPESHEDCLRRELREELQVELQSATFFMTKKFFHEKAQDMQTIHYYIVKCKGEFTPSMEITKIFWYTRENFTNGEPKTTQVLHAQVLPELLAQQLL
jgi:ADP-ribose pyrophosphatase YjhB (NUDIX family)